MDSSDDEEADADRYEKRQAVIHHRSLQSKLESIIEATRGNGCSPGQLAQLALEAGKDMDGIGSFLSNRIPAMAYNELRRDDSTTASRVFDIPELTEAILCHVSTRRLWKIYEVSRGLKDIIDASHKLQVKLWLEPAPSTVRFEILRDMPRGNIQIGRRYDLRPGQHIPEAHREYGRAPKVGSRRRKMLIC